MEAILPGLMGGMGGGRGRGRTRIQISRGNNPPLQNLGMDQAALENAIQDFVVNLAGMGFAGGGQMGAMQAMQMGGHAPGGNAQLHFVGPGMQIHGNPRDYAWGRGGLDTIITMLLNQVDGAGPPPMDRETIREIPSVKISKEQVEATSSCSVCWEDFTIGEEVKRLECDHFYHGACIEPWLELHGTCPVCRKVLNPGAAAAARGAAAPTDQQEPPDTPPPPPPPPRTTSAAPAPPSSEVPSSSSGSTSPGGSGGGGLTGLIVSALNQVFNYNNRSSQPQASEPPNAPASSSTSSVPSSSAPSTSVASSGSSSGGASARSGGDSNDTSAARSDDEERPASRRQRLDSDFVDFDLE